MGGEIIGLLAVALLCALILLKVPIGVSLALAGLVSTGLLIGFEAALAVVGIEVLVELMSQDLALVALFLLMGNLAGAAGLSSDLYALAEAWLGHRRGGLAMATIGACAGFGAICGSSIATTATMTRLALPEMRKRGYTGGLATGSIAAGATLGIIVPPSIMLVLYAVLTEQDVTALFVAALVPAALALGFYLAAVSVYVRLRPASAPAGHKADRRRRIAATRRAAAFLLLATVISGGIYSGAFTVSEAASVGVSIAFIVLVLRGRLSRSSFVGVLRETASGTSMIYLILIGASIFGYTVTLSGLPAQLTGWIESLGLPPLAVIFLIELCYIIMGSLFDTVAAMIITLPFVFPLILALGFDPVWWGVINVIVMEIGMITPPFGMNVFVLHGLAPETGFTTIWRGLTPFIVADLLRLVLLTLIPTAVLWLPVTLGF